MKMVLIFENKLNSDVPDVIVRSNFKDHTLNIRRRQFKSIWRKKISIPETEMKIANKLKKKIWIFLK